MSGPVALCLLLPGVVVTWIVTGFPDLTSGRPRRACGATWAWSSGMTQYVLSGRVGEGWQNAGTIPGCRVEERPLGRLEVSDVQTRCLLAGGVAAAA